MIDIIKSHIFNNFGLVTESSDTYRIKVKGIDSDSLAEWISEEFTSIKVKVVDKNWIKIETTTE